MAISSVRLRIVGLYFNKVVNLTGMPGIGSSYTVGDLLDQAVQQFPTFGFQAPGRVVQSFTNLPVDRQGATVGGSITLEAARDLGDGNTFLIWQYYVQRPTTNPPELADPFRGPFNVSSAATLPSVEAGDQDIVSFRHPVGAAIQHGDTVVWRLVAIYKRPFGAVAS